MKPKINLWEWIPKLLVPFGIYVIAYGELHSRTSAFTMTLGVTMLLLLLEQAVVQYAAKRRKQKDDETDGTAD
ncbi:MAG: hypothetical protein IJ710_03615 [Prevotella sp.]|nr:hypothetical protein [Prevotella sp.]